jgi:hypothetical protein
LKILWFFFFLLLYPVPFLQEKTCDFRSESRFQIFLSFSALMSTNFSKNCLISPIYPSLIGSSIFTGIDYMTGSYYKIGQTFAFYSASLYCYNILVCSMEMIHKKRSSLHNVLSAGTLGYLGTSSGYVTPPFYHTMASSFPRMSPASMSFLAYGGLAFIFATAAGKPLRL